MDGLELSEVAETDLASLTRFVALVFGREPSLVQSWFDHWWRLNPSWDESIPRGWLLRAQNHDIIAFTSNIPLPYVIARQRGVCYVTGTTGVHPDWRGKGLSKLVARPFVEQKTPDLLVGTGSTPEAFKLWQSLGMISLRLEWPSSCPRVIVSHQRWIKAAAMRLRAPKFMASSLSVLGLLMDKRIARAHSSGAVEQISQFEIQDSERLLECRASDASTYALRDVSTVNWLYFGTSYNRQSRLVFAARSGGRLRGFAAFKILGPSLLLLECRCLGADPGIAADLLTAAAVRWRQRGGAFLMIWPYTPMVKAALPRTRNSTFVPMTYVYKANSASLIERDWERTPGDGDISLF